MNPLLKGATALGTIAGVTGASYGIYSTMQSTPEKSTYAKELNGTLLTAEGATHQTQWKARLTSLKSVDSDTKLVENLKQLKSKEVENAWTELRDWCNNNINNQSKGKEDKEFLNIQAYCTFSIKEKIGTAIEEGTGDHDTKWGTAHEELKKINDSELDNTLKANKAKTIDNTVKKAIKDWCVASYKKPYKGEKDQEFKNASKICINK